MENEFKIINVCSNYKLNKFKINSILKEIKNEIKLNEAVIKSVNKIDFSHYNRNIDINDLMNIIEEYQTDEYIAKDEPCNILASYYGDPFITLNLCMQAIKTNTNVILSIQDMMLGVNKVLVKIVNNVLEDNNIKNMISFYNLLNVKQIAKNEKNINKIICIGNENTYTVFKENKLKKLYYYPYNNIEIYCDSKELLELQKNLQVYAYKNNIEIDIIDEESLDSAINRINKYGKGFASVILTEDYKHAEIFKNNVISKNIFINENPFKQRTLKMPEIL